MHLSVASRSSAAWSDSGGTLASGKRFESTLSSRLFFSQPKSRHGQGQGGAVPRTLRAVVTRTSLLLLNPAVDASVGPYKTPSSPSNTAICLVTFDPSDPIQRSLTSPRHTVPPDDAARSWTLREAW